MPPLLVPSPVILDQSFPREFADLQRVAVALGEIEATIAIHDAHLVLTNTLKDFVSGIDWNSPPANQGLLREVYTLLIRLSVQPRPNIVNIETGDVQQYVAHPLPAGVQEGGLTLFWCDEVGRLLALHDMCIVAPEYCLGIACDSGFAGGQPNPCAGQARAFPAVGRGGLASLVDAYEWDVPSNQPLDDVTFAEAYANCGAIGATEVRKPTRGSHYKVKFSGARSWTLDRNTDPVPERFLRQLEPISGYPTNVVRWALKNGRLPRRRLCLSRVTRVS